MFKNATLFALALVSTPAFADDKAAAGKLLDKTLDFCVTAQKKAQKGNAQDKLRQAWIRERGGWLALQAGELKVAGKLSMLARMNCRMVMSQNNDKTDITDDAAEMALIRGVDRELQKKFEAQALQETPKVEEIAEKFDAHR